jgi:wyosine [tRNA(Phe)-imidazoG37] synthetase (radical SAM superfamily)
MEGLEAVKAMESYIREIESLRVQIRSAVSPPNEFVRRSQAENEQFLASLVHIDRELMQALSVIDEDSIPNVRRLLQRRTDTVRAFEAR